RLTYWNPTPDSRTSFLWNHVTEEICRTAATRLTQRHVVQPRHQRRAGGITFERAVQHRGFQRNRIEVSVGEEDADLRDGNGLDFHLQIDDVERDCQRITERRRVLTGDAERERKLPPDKTTDFTAGRIDAVF